MLCHADAMANMDQTLAFYGIVPNLIELIVITCLVKYAIAIVDTPFMYLARYWATRFSAKEEATELIEPGIQSDNRLQTD